MTGYDAVTRARTLIEIKRYGDAIVALEPALTDDRTAGVAFCLLAQCRLGVGQLTAAEEAARSALAAGEHGEWPHRLLAISYLRRRMGRSALAAAQEAVRAEPERPETLHVQCLALLACRRRRQALSLAKHNVRLNPDSSVAFFTLGLCLRVSRQYADAEAAYLEALRLDPDNTEAALGLGQTLQKLGRHHDAGQVFLAAARSDPSNDRPRKALTSVSLSTGGLITAYLAVRLMVGSVEKNSLSLGTYSVLWFLFTAIGGGVATWLRMRTSAALPAEVRSGLRIEYRKTALAWVFGAGVGSVVLGALGVADPSMHSPALGVVLLVVGVVLIGVHQRFRVAGTVDLLAPARRLRQKWTRT
ncbi:tetratricopeptide repeat protein [Amycolatopsis sp. GM8]|uniref:tetratricopeptide repeat protein n=1 Tax=Amycolatopsis sp. GM8 TaxID=2896530 RepID=UPI001F32D872|nr:tetratricopeptide repeat protein [Amycolatopsis sp. GM8]